MKHATVTLLRSIARPACVVLGIGTVTGLSIIRGLGRHGLTVIGLDSDQQALGAYSKHCAAIETFGSDTDMLSLLLAMGKESSQRNVLFCESDRMALFLDRHRQRLQQYYHVGQPSKTPLERIIDKKSMIRLAGASGIPTPLTVFFPETSFEDMKDAVRYPAIVKPTFTQSEFRTKGSIATDQASLARALSDARFSGGCIVQEVVPGNERGLWTCMGYADRNGEPLVLVTGHKLRQSPRDYGIATLAVGMHNAQVKELTRSFLGFLGYSGCFELEFKEREDSGEYLFIEINPRICSLNDLAEASGVPIPYLAYRDATGMPVERTVSQKEGIVWMHLTKDLTACVRYYTRDNPLVLADWAAQAFTRDTDAVFDSHDLKPFFHDALRRVKKGLTTAVSRSRRQ